MPCYADQQKAYQASLIDHSVLFDGDRGGGVLRSEPRTYALQDGRKNLYAPIREDVLRYFKVNKISWWGGKLPTANLLSSQVACLNHLYPLRHDPELVLALLNGVRNEFTEVLPIQCDKEPSYIAFEVVSKGNNLNESGSNRGAQCTSVDALIYARHRSGALWLIPIEWKFTERYYRGDKSSEGDPDGRGKTRLNRYCPLIDQSTQLIPLKEYKGSVYFQDPFYQLMRQTLWAEQIIRHKGTEILKADDFLHLHIIPSANLKLLAGPFVRSPQTMEETWRSCLKDPSKYMVLDPQKLLAPLADRCSDLMNYLKQRYWQMPSKN